MRIGMILDSSFPPDYRVEKEALTLTAHGHEVILFCLTYSGNLVEERYKGFTVIHYPSSRLEYKLSALAYTFPFYHFSMAAKISKFCVRYKPQVLHVHDMVIAKAAFEIAKKNKIPTVLDLHENRPESMKDYRHLRRFPGNMLINLAVWERKQYQLVGQAAKIIVVTELAMEDLIVATQRRRSDFYVIPNTSDESFDKVAVDPRIIGRMNGTFNILYVGDTSLRRGTGDVISALVTLRDRIPTIRLWIVGASSADRELMNLADNLGVRELVCFEGWQPQELFTSYITGSHVCVSPLRRNRHHDTTFANKVFQYMALAKPVVVSDCVAQAELITEEKCGLVHKAGDAVNLSEVILTLYQDQNLRTQLGTNGKTAVNLRWRWEVTSKPLVKLYEDISIGR
jgi:glycosyltransferase involved in cell wall biosynthesis